MSRTARASTAALLLTDPALAQMPRMGGPMKHIMVGFAGSSLHAMVDPAVDKPIMQDYGETYTGGAGEVTLTWTAFAPACPAHFNRDAPVTIQGNFDFLTGYFGGAAHTDVNHDGVNSVKDVFDDLATCFNGCGRSTGLRRTHTPTRAARLIQ